MMWRRTGPSLTALPLLGHCGRRSSPTAGQAPDARRDQLDGVARRVADVERSAAAGPALDVLDRVAGRFEALAPRVEIGVGDAERDVPGTVRAVGRQVLAPGTG